MRYCVSVSYDGGEFCGWQIQPSAPSVQECLQAALSRLLGCSVSVTGAGRTDTSVNAVNYIAHFDLDGSLPYGQTDFCYKLNAILPHSVVINSIVPVPDDFHSRFGAVRREYTYFIHRCKDPFLRHWSWQCGFPDLDFEAMNKACAYLPGTRDFSCFEKTGGSSKTPVCTVYEAFWAPYTPSHLTVMPSAEAPSADSPYWYFRISANRFLRNMVRAVVGSLIEVGRGKQSPEWIGQLISSGTRSDAGESVPGHALFLSKVLYQQ